MNYRLQIIILLLAINYQLSTIDCFSQGVGVNTTGVPADNSAMLDVSATGKGLLIPRMSTAQRPANPVESLIIYNTETQCFEAYNAATSKWVDMACLGSGWKCGSALIDSRDAKSYKTVMIGTQCWMKEDLNVGTRIDVANNQANNGIIEKYCAYDDENNCNVYGALYQWNEMMLFSKSEGIQGICPTDWHIPTDAEWSILSSFVGGLSVAGGKLKEVGTTHWASPNNGATDDVGFTALPGGYRADIGFTNSTGGRGNWWTSTENVTDWAWCRIILTEQIDATRSSPKEVFGYSVRCVKNN